MIKYKKYKNNPDYEFISYGDGGSVNPSQYIVEKGEVVQGYDTRVEQGRKMSNDMTAVDGHTHEQGGTKGEGGDRVFSNRIRVSPQLSQGMSAMGFKNTEDFSYADLAKKIAEKKGSIEKLMGTKNPYRANTYRIMKDRLEKMTDDVFNDQEASKGPNGMPKNEQQFMYGGDRKKYQDGGKLSLAMKIQKAQKDSANIELNKKAAQGAYDYEEDSSTHDRDSTLNAIDSHLQRYIKQSDSLHNVLDSLRKINPEIKKYAGGGNMGPSAGGVPSISSEQAYLQPYGDLKHGDDISTIHKKHKHEKRHVEGLKFEEGGPVMEDGFIENANKEHMAKRIKEVGIEAATKEYNDFMKDGDMSGEEKKMEVEKPKAKKRKKMFNNK